MTDGQAATATATATASAIRDVMNDIGEPLNALVVWTELGRGLCGTLDRKGADVGLLGRLIARWCASAGADMSVRLESWIYALPAERRLTAAALSAALQRAEEAIAAAAAPLLEAVEDPDRHRRVFLATVKGWFVVGDELLFALPPGRSATRAARLGALAAWCDRYLPHDTAGPADLGVRVLPRGA